MITYSRNNIPTRRDIVGSIKKDVIYKSSRGRMDTLAYQWKV